MVLPSLLLDTLKCPPAMEEYDDKIGYSIQWTMDKYDKTSDGFVIVMLKHTHMSKHSTNMTSIDVFVIRHRLYTLICSKQWMNMTPKLHQVMVLPSLLLDTLKCPPAMDEYDDKIGYSIQWFCHLYRQTHSDIQSSGQILTTRLDRVMVLPSVSLDTLKCSKQWTNTTRPNLVMVLSSSCLNTLVQSNGQIRQDWILWRFCHLYR